MVADVPYAGTVEQWAEQSAERTVFDWPGMLAYEPKVWPTLWIRVTTPRDQSSLHREVASLGYVPELIAQDEDCDYWRFTHPDGPR